MAKLVVLRGLPACGKSTHAAQLVLQGYKRVNKDDLRMIIDNGAYSKDNERLITTIANNIMESALASGFNVVSDNTNLNKYHIAHCQMLARMCKAEIEIITFDTPLDVCLARDLARTHGRVGKDVIMKMYARYYRDGKLIDEK